MAAIKQFLLDELHTFPASFVELKIQSYDGLSEIGKRREYLALMYHKVHSRNIEHPLEVIQQLTPDLQMETSDPRRRNYVLYLLAVAYFRTGNTEMCLDMLNQRNHAVTPHAHTLSFVLWLDRYLHTSTSKYVTQVIGRGLVVTVGLYYVVKLGRVLFPQMAKGLKLCVKNMEVVSDGGKVGVAMKLPFREQV